MRGDISEIYLDNRIFIVDTTFLVGYKKLKNKDFKLCVLKRDKKEVYEF